MKKTATLLIMGCMVMLLTQCAKKSTPSKSTTSTAATPEDEVAAIKKNYTPGQITAGKLVFEKSCSSCHELRQPQEFTVKMWDKILPKMCHKAELTTDEAGIVRAYAITNAKAG